VAPSALPLDEGWLTPAALDEVGMARIKAGFVAATTRAVRAGFDVVEIHSAHGYLLASFLAPLTNRRTDAYGGSRENRMRFPLEIAEAVRAAWPPDRPLFVRVSAIDGVEGGVAIEDTIAYAAALKARGVDLIDCSSGGIAGSATAAKGPPRGYGFQVEYAERIRREIGIPTMAVGLIVDPRQAEAVLEGGSADLVAIGREALADPNWALHAEAALAAAAADAPFALWPKQSGWWLALRARALDRLGPWRG
jgi:2,4-dienoyl-CoA reductase-like NADH-dependent reductase (Old Yellow Enzyme family)